MALVEVKELKERSSSIKVIPKGEKQYVRTWHVIVSDPHEDAVDVENYWSAQTSIDAGDPFPSDAYAFAKDIRTQCTSVDGKQWSVTCNYGSLDNENNQTNPLLKPAEYEWSFGQFTENTNYDIYGNAIVNSAGDMFLGGVQRDNSRPVLKVTQNESFFSPLLAGYYKDSINGNYFVGAPPKTAKVSNISAKSTFDGVYNFWYWIVNYEFMFDFRTWDAILMDQGLREKSQSGDVTPIMDGGGEKISEPVLLDGQGSKLQAGNTPIYGNYTIYPIVPFYFGF